MQYCSLQHQTLLSPPDISIAKCLFCFCPATSFFLELLVIALCSSSVAYWIPSNLWGSSSSVIPFAFSYCLWDSPGKNTGADCHFLHWTMFCQKTLHYAPSILGPLHSLAHSFLELCKPLCHDKAAIHEGDWPSWQCLNKPNIFSAL